MFSNIRKVYAPGVPDGTVTLWANGGRVKAVHSRTGSWWAPDVLYFTQSMSLHTDSVNLLPAEDGSPTVYARPGRYTFKGHDGVSEPEGSVYVVKPDGTRLRYALNSSVKRTTLGVGPGDKLSFDIKFSFMPVPLQVQRFE